MTGPVISHRDWIKLTDGGRLSVRSTELKAVDEALKAYHLARTPAALGRLQGTLLKWMQLKQGAWKTSIRNRNGAVEALYRQVSGLGTGGTPTLGDEIASAAALRAAREESRRIVAKIFQGKELVFRPGLTTKLAGDGTLGKLGTQYAVVGIARNANTVSGGAIARGIGALPGQAAGGLRHLVPTRGGSGGEAAALASALVRELTPPDVLPDVMQAMASVMPTFMTELAASCAPFVGVITSGGGVLVSAGTTLRATYRLHDARIHAERTLSASDPEAAFAAVVRMLDRELNAELVGLARGVAEFGGKLAGALADGGTATNAAIGLASGVAKLVLLLRIMVRDIQERNAANRLLMMPTVTGSLFQACPVMGAYLVLCAPTSVLVNTILSREEFYQPTMMPKVERAVKRHVEPMKEQAQRLVREHRMYIPELQRAPGVLEKNEKELERMLKSAGKTAMTGFGSDTPIYDLPKTVQDAMIARALRGEPI